MSLSNRRIEGRSGLSFDTRPRQARSLLRMSGFDIRPDRKTPMSDDTTVFKLPETLPSPSELADAWARVIANAVRLAGTTAERTADPHVPHAFAPAAPARAFAEFGAHLVSHPAELWRAQQRAAGDWMRLWGHAAARVMGMTPDPLAEPARGDRRFKDPAWSEEPLFDYLKQAYLLTARRAEELVAGAEG